MSIPIWVLLGFAAWTVLTLVGSVGIMRWARIFTGRAQLTDFPADEAHGTPPYRRAMRAHMNCVENLPVYGAVAVAILATGSAAPALDALALAFLGGRIAQTVVHVALSETNLTVMIRFVFFFAQIACVVAMGTIVAVTAW